MKGTSIVAVFFVIAPSIAQADINLGGTSWYNVNSDCQIIEIDFNAGGTADISFASAQDDRAVWTLVGKVLNIETNTLKVRIEGSLANDNRIHATISSGDMNVPDTCSFENAV